MKLLEKRLVEQTVFDGAQLNNYIARGSSGRVFGLELSHTSQKIFIKAGLLMIRGYRVVFDNEEIYSIKVFPANTEISYLILRITVDLDGSREELLISKETFKDDIEKGPGVYDYLLAEIRLTSDGIIEVDSKIKDASYGTGSPTDPEGPTLNATTLEIEDVYFGYNSTKSDQRNLGGRSLKLIVKTKPISPTFEAYVKTGQATILLNYPRKSPKRIRQFGFTNSFNPTVNKQGYRIRLDYGSVVRYEDMKHMYSKLMFEIEETDIKVDKLGNKYIFKPIAWNAFIHSLFCTMDNTPNFQNIPIGQEEIDNATEIREMLEVISQDVYGSNFKYHLAPSQQHMKISMHAGDTSAKLTSFQSIGYTVVAGNAGREPKIIDNSTLNVSAFKILSDVIVAGLDVFKYLTSYNKPTGLLKQIRERNGWFKFKNDYENENEDRDHKWNNVLRFKPSIAVLKPNYNYDLTLDQRSDGDLKVDYNKDAEYIFLKKGPLYEKQIKSKVFILAKSYTPEPRDPNEVYELNAPTIVLKNKIK